MKRKQRAGRQPCTKIIRKQWSRFPRHLTLETLQWGTLLPPLPPGICSCSRSKGAALNLVASGEHTVEDSFRSDSPWRTFCVKIKKPDPFSRTKEGVSVELECLLTFYMLASSSRPPSSQHGVEQMGWVPGSNHLMKRDVYCCDFNAVSTQESSFRWSTCLWIFSGLSGSSYEGLTWKW